MSAKIIFISILCILTAICVFILRKARYKKRQALTMQSTVKLLPVSLVEDFTGDNRWDTELDLAKAYLELHQNDKAKHLLKSVILYGDSYQILEARKMFTLLLKQERTS